MINLTLAEDDHKEHKEPRESRRGSMRPKTPSHAMMKRPSRFIKIEDVHGQSGEQDLVLQ